MGQMKLQGRPKESGRGEPREEWQHAAATAEQEDKSGKAKVQRGLRSLASSQRDAIDHCEVGIRRRGWRCGLAERVTCGIGTKSESLMALVLALLHSGDAPPAPPRRGSRRIVTKLGEAKRVRSLRQADGLRACRIERAAMAGWRARGTCARDHAGPAGADLCVVAHHPDREVAHAERVPTAKDERRGRAGHDLDVRRGRLAVD